MDKNQIAPEKQLEGRDVEISSSGWAIMEKTWERVQTKAFTKWVNSYLMRRGMKIEKLDEDFKDGILLVNFLEIISNQKAPGKITKRARMKIQKIQNNNLAMKFIKMIGVNLIAIQAEDICDGNLKLILGMIWTIIQKYQIDDISEEDLTAKEALLLWCKKKTKGYDHVNVTNLHTSFRDGMAFCALIHKHRPDLIDYDKLDPKNARENLETAFTVAEKELGIPQLLDVEDMLDTPKPDERSVITYLSQYYHAFAGQRKTGEAADAIGRVVDLQSANEKMQNDYETRAKELRDWIIDNDNKMKDRTTDGTIQDINDKLSDLEDHRNNRKPPKAAEKLELESLLNTIQMKLKNANRAAYSPPEGLSPNDINDVWGDLGKDEKEREAWLRDLLKKKQQQEALKNRFGDKADALEKWIENKQDYLKTEETVDSLPVAKSKLKICEAFSPEYKQSEKNVNEVSNLADDLIKAGHPEKDAIGQRRDQIKSDWDGLKPLHDAKLDDLKKKLAREELKEQTRLEFAKAAKEYANWVKKAQNDFIGENFGDSLEAVQAYKEKLDASDKDFNAKNDEKKKHLDDLWNKLQELGVKENRHTTYTNEDIGKFHNDLKGGLDKRQAAYKEELERQLKMEELRKKFAKLADEFVKSIDDRKNGITSLKGEPDDLVPQVKEKYDEGKPESEKLEELSKLAAEMSKLGISSNKHTKFTLPDLKVQNKQFGRWVRNYIYQLGQERDLKVEYTQRAKALVDWCDKTLPTLDKSSEFDGTLNGIRNLRRKWNVYKTSDSAEQEIEKDNLHKLEKRIASILEETKRPEWTPPEGITKGEIDQKWGGIQAAEKKTDEAINKELERQENIAILIRRFNNDHSDLSNFVDEKEQFFAEKVQAATLRDARLQNKLLQINLEEVDFKKKRLEALKSLKQEIADYKYPEMKPLDEKLAELEKRWDALSAQADEKRKGIAGNLEVEEGKEKLRTDFAENAKGFQRWVHDSVESINDYNFGPNSEAVNAYKAELDKNDNALKTEADERKNKISAINKQMQEKGVTENKYTNLKFDDVEKQYASLQEAIAARQKAYAAEVDKMAAQDLKRKEFAEKAEKFINWVQSKKEIFEKLEGTPDEKIQKVNDEYKGGEPNKKMVAEIEALATQMAQEGIHGNSFTSVSLPIVQMRNTQYDNSVKNFLGGLKEEKEFEARQKKQEEAYKERERVEGLTLDFNTKANILKMWAIQSQSLLSESILASSVSDVKELQQQVSKFEAEQVPQNKKLYEEILQVHKQLVEAKSNASADDVKADWENVQKRLKERKAELAEEEKKQESNDVLRKEFAGVAEDFSKWIEAQNKTLGNQSGSLEDQLHHLSKLSEKVTSEGNQKQEAVAASQEKLNNAQVSSNAFTDLTPATLSSEYNALKDAVAKRQAVVDQEILRQKGQDVTPEELKEYKEVFQHFDKENKNLLDKLNFKAVLQALGEDLDDEKIDAVIKEVDTTRQDGCVSFDEFVSFMEKRKKKSDSKSDIIESFKAIAGDKEFITQADLLGVLPKDKVEYLISKMPKYKDMEDGYDYTKWTGDSFGG